MVAVRPVQGIAHGQDHSGIPAAFTLYPLSGLPRCFVDVPVGCPSGRGVVTCTQGGRHCAVAQACQGGS
ncbi:hypothetical protein AERO8C_140181 [Aeromonas veronii]|uniref:Uncharacterized protein n=1 Tax=Aeromonas veronii TaxID=654 RepID=A0A653KTL7_AERVE|nr:hypothetical protein AERO8C_140181 [Aeromonas veronii]